MKRALRAGPAALLSMVIATAIASYGQRLVARLPLYAWDEHGFAIRALFQPDAIARNPFVPAHRSGLYLAVIRLAHAISPNYLPWLRAMNVAAYFGGLVALAMVATRDQPARTRWLALAGALAFPYYRFVVSGLPEGVYVGMLAVLAIATWKLCAGRPLLHALASGVLSAGLVLLKPHGLAVVAGLVAVALLDGAVGRQLKTAVLRILIFAVSFFVAGNALQWATGQGVQSPLLFFLDEFYRGVLGAHLVPGAVRLAAINLLAMASTVLMFGGIPMAAGLARLHRRWKSAGAGFRFDSPDLTFLLLLLSLGATLLMVAVLAMKLASDPGETLRLWGRYFEFFIPLIWLVSAGALQDWDQAGSRRTGRVMAAVTLCGLAGLMLSFRLGIVLMPWDGTAVTAFFRPDPVRAGFVAAWPYRLLAVTATLLAAVALGLGHRARNVWPAYIAAICVLATAFDQSSMDGMFRQRIDLANDISDAGAAVSRTADPMAGVAPDANDADMIFAGFGGRPRVTVWAAPYNWSDLDAYQTLIVGKTLGAPPPRAWAQMYQGRQVNVFVRRPPAG